MKPQPTSPLVRLSRNLPATLITVIIGLLLLMIWSWYSTATRISALEAQLAALSVKQPYTSPANIKPSAIETGRKAPRDQPLQPSEHRAATGKEVRTRQTSQAITDTSPNQGSLIDSQARLAKQKPVTVSNPVHGLIEAQTDSPSFRDGLQSLYRSLQLSPGRRAEVSKGLEDMLRSIWPQYLAAAQNPAADTTALQQLYCNSASAILRRDETERLGC